MKIAVTIARILLGLIYFVFGLNFFLHFIPQPPPPAGKVAAFEMGLMGSGYFFQYMKVIEILSGLFLLLNRYTPLFTLIIFPVTLNIFLFHAFLVPSGVAMGLVILLINLFLAYAYRQYYASVFVSKPTLL